MLVVVDLIIVTILKKKQTCLALDLVIVSESGCFFSFTAVLENNSTNSSKFMSGSSIFSHTDEEETSLKNMKEHLDRLSAMKSY